MREEDRSAIHEAMEQQTVSIAKAGIVARLNARTTVIAAGNPRFGRYLPDRPLAENINLPPPILSRFDLIFVIRDVPDPERDRALARFVLQVHSDIDFAKPEIEPELLRKYISYARRYIRPRLTEEAMRLLEDFFTEMRKAAAGPNSAIPLTARQLEALIRLAEAHARMKLRDRVTREDAEVAIRLVLSFLSSAGIDVESGSIDIDSIMTGKPRSKREKMVKVLNLLRELLEETGEKCIHFKELVKRASQEGIESHIVEETIQSLLRDGIVYEAQPGCYALT
jgi:replicative DNA helicase Mcm